MAQRCLPWTPHAGLGRGLTSPDVRLGRQAVSAQIVRIGTRSIAIVLVVSTCIGLILAMAMYPPLEQFGQEATIANIVAIAISRELGPMISAIVLTGFAGASIAAELGTMVVGEEIEALEAHALNPVRFLVLPRLIATVISLVMLTVMADVVAILGAAVLTVTAFDVSWNVYIANTLAELGPWDIGTGLIKAATFGVMLAALACYNGLKVSGGAAGVGKATNRHGRTDHRRRDHRRHALHDDLPATRVDMTRRPGVESARENRYHPCRRGPQ